MHSPDNHQQESDSKSLNEVLEEQWDEMEASEETTDEELDAAEQKAETQEHEAEAEADAEETSGEEESKEELKEEIKEAAESDYNEPAPERWPEDIQKVYNGLPPEARKAMLEGIYKPMQRSYTQATQELSQMRNQFNPVLETMEQHRPVFQHAGVDPVQAFQTQMAWAAHLQRVGPEQGLLDMQQAYGVGTQKPEGQEPYLTPTERAFKQQIDALQQQVAGQQNQFQQTSEQQQQAQIAAQRNEIQQNLNTFINEKTEDGNLAHPHVERLASNIAGIIRGGLVSKADEYGNPISMRDQLASAYSMACNLDPSTRTQPVNTGQADLAKAAQKVDVVTKHPAAHVATDDDIPMSDFIEKQWERMSRRSA